MFPGRPGGDERVDLGVGTAQLAQHLPRVLAEQRRGGADRRGRLRHLRGHAEGVHRPDDRVRHVEDHLAGRDLRLGQRLAVGQDRPARDARAVERRDPVRGRPRRQDLLQFPGQLLDVPHPVPLGLVLGPLAQVGPLDHLVAEPLPEPVGVGPDGHVPVLGAECLVGGGEPVPASLGPRLCAPAPPGRGLPDGEGDTGVHERDVDVLAAALAQPPDIGGEHGGRRGHAGGEVGDGDPELRGLAPGFAGHPQETGHALGDDVEPRAVPLGAGLPEPADRAVDDPGVERLRGRVVQAEPAHHAGPEVLDDDVRPRDEIARDGAPVGAGEVQREGPLVAVGHRGRVALAVDEGRDAPGFVAGAGPLDLDDVGAVVGEDHRAVRPGQEAGEVDDGHPGQGQHHYLRPLASGRT